MQQILATPRSLWLAATLGLWACERAEARGKSTVTRPELNASCIRCHQAEAQQWDDSLHHHSWTDNDFAHAYRNEPSQFCWGCHAPESSTNSRPRGAAARSGVTCVSCHVDPAHDPVNEDVHKPGHPEMVRPDILETDTCGRCHEFGFESNASLPMQSTRAEHLDSSDADMSCSSCHMAQSGHTFAVTRDPATLRAAVEVVAEREGDVVRLRLRSLGVGHAFPTGDTFRALHIEVGREDGPVSAETRLQRVFALERHGGGLGFALEEVADTRLAADGSVTTLELAVPAAQSDALWWRVVYERRDNPFKATPRTFDRVELARGRLETKVAQ